MTDLFPVSRCQCITLAEDKLISLFTLHIRKEIAGLVIWLIWYIYNSLLLCCSFKDYFLLQLLFIARIMPAEGVNVMVFSVFYGQTIYYILLCLLISCISGKNCVWNIVSVIRGWLIKTLLNAVTIKTSCPILSIVEQTFRDTPHAQFFRKINLTWASSSISQIVTELLQQLNAIEFSQTSICIYSL